MKRQHANKILTANDNLGIALSAFVIYALHDSGIDQRLVANWEGVIAEPTFLMPALRAMESIY